MGLGLTDGNVDALEARTEGWIAALQLAALSMEGRTDVSGFIAGFAGDDRYVVDYLVEEVLQRQPDAIRDFLLRTSILARMTGALCDAVTGAASGSATLEALERANLFLVPLDDQRRWYRYHHLFADVLQARMLDERPDEVGDLHRRASDWYEVHGDRAEAVRHALAGKDFERAADLIELAVPSMQRARQETTLRAWCDALPEDLFRVRPVLAVQYVGALMSTGHLNGADALLRDAERALADPRGIVVVDDAAFRRLPGAIARYRAAQALVVGDLAGTRTHARQALAAADEDDHLGLGAAAAILGLAEWSSGNLDAAYRSYSDGMTSLERGGFLPDAVGGAITMADIRITQGRLAEAMRIYERGLALATRTEGIVLRGAADMHVGMAEILLERNDLEGAKAHLQASRGLGEAQGFPKHPWRSRVATARLRWAEGALDDAIELLNEAERRYVADYAPNVRPVGALRARLWIAQGRLPEASAWARERGLSATDEVTYLREFEHVILARLLLAQGERDGTHQHVREAVALSERLLVAADEGGRAGSAIEILVVQALARHALGDASGAIASLHRAVALAEPEGYVRVFLDEGPPMAALVKLALKERNAPGYIRQLFAALAPIDAPPSGPQPLIEPLSERELEVLRLLQGDLDGPDIARELSVSLNTLRTHTKNIYAKLGVTSRRAAVRRAGELDLLARR
jgi:LuxR family maltose regulon positive regulatory protein